MPTRPRATLILKKGPITSSRPVATAAALSARITPRSAARRPKPRRRVEREFSRSSGLIRKPVHSGFKQA